MKTLLLGNHNCHHHVHKTPSLSSVLNRLPFLFKISLPASVTFITISLHCAYVSYLRLLPWNFLTKNLYTFFVLKSVYNSIIFDLMILVVKYNDI